MSLRKLVFFSCLKGCLIFGQHSWGDIGIWSARSRVTGKGSEWQVLLLSDFKRQNSWFFSGNRDCRSRANLRSHDMQTLQGKYGQKGVVWFESCLERPWDARFFSSAMPKQTGPRKAPNLSYFAMIHRWRNWAGLLRSEKRQPPYWFILGLKKGFPSQGRQD